MNRYPHLIRLADACNSGAPNMGALLRSLSKAAEEIPHSCHREHPAIKCILGHLSYLCNESLGPSAEAMNEYDAWKAQLQAEAASPERTEPELQTA